MVYLYGLKREPIGVLVNILVASPNEYEAIFTQEKCVDEDVVEFLTLKEIDFSQLHNTIC